MNKFLVQNAASYRIDEIFCHTLKQWGKAQADAYVCGLFEAFGKINNHEVTSRSIPAEFGVGGYFFRYEKHFVYWKNLSRGDIGIVTVLHESMHQIDRFKDDFSL